MRIAVCFFVSNVVNAYMYAPKKIIFFDFDKTTPRLATRWGGCSLSGVVHICIITWFAWFAWFVWFVRLVRLVRLVRSWIASDEHFSLNRYARALNMYVRMKYHCKCKQM